MENLKEKKQGKIIGFLCILCVLLAFTSFYFAFSGNRIRQRERLINEKAVSSLCENLDSISISLQKSIYSADKTALAKNGNELCRQAASAKESLSLLSPGEEFCDEIYKFLSQVGNYTLAVAQGEEKTSKEQLKSLRELYAYAKQLSEGMNEICYDYYNGDISFDEAIGNLESETDAPDVQFYSRVNDAAQTLSDYPTLVYDGPFADDRNTGKAEYIEKSNEITAEEAAQKISELFGFDKGTLKREENIDGDIELYCFSKGKTDITVTRKGGYICSVMSDTYAYEETISVEEAVQRGVKILGKLGYKNMKNTYYSIYDGICTVNFAFAEDGIICYADLIKVSISLDKGKLVGLDAKPFLLSHHKRVKEGKLLDESSVTEKLAGGLSVIGSQLAYIPLDTGEETLCYEFHCKDSEGQEVLIYFDAYNAQQRDILILLYSDGGVLTK